MSKRHDAIGIKQAIRLEWMQKTANLLLAGLDTKAIRSELNEFLAEQKINGSDCDRSAQSRNFAVINLMRSWVTPDPELLLFRDASLEFLQQNPSMSFAVHWGMISAVYPFWFNVARQTGRLLALQDQITQIQIINRLKEQYGDRQSVSRYARFVIRSFVDWGALKDSEAKGCYEKSTQANVSDPNLAILMFEAALYATPENKGSLGLLMNNPSFFPFNIPVMSGDFISQRSDRLDVIRYGLDEELLELKRKAVMLTNLAVII